VISPHIDAQMNPLSLRSLIATNPSVSLRSRCALPDSNGVVRCPTSFPNPIGLSATFNASLWRRMGATIGVELRALWLQGVGENHGNNLPHLGLDCWSPNINVARDPRWGRILETSGEDPFLSGRFGAAYTQGLQQASPAEPHGFLQGVATLKHFAAYSLEAYRDVTRHTFDAVASPYDLATTYWPAWRNAIVAGGARGVMCSYNEVRLFYLQLANH
jgi:beta-glucosidase-like glycosyl hydrolase